MSLEIVGWIGAIFLACCGMPQALQSWKEGHSNGLSWGLILLWLFGEIFTLAYVIPTGNLPLIFNYIFNIIVILVMLRYKIWPRKT